MTDKERFGFESDWVRSGFSALLVSGLEESDAHVILSFEEGGTCEQSATIHCELFRL